MSFGDPAFLPCFCGGRARCRAAPVCPRASTQRGQGRAAPRGEPWCSTKWVSLPPYLACMVLPFGCSLFSRAGLPAPLCRALPAAHGKNEQNRVRGHPKCCCLELLCMMAGPARLPHSMSVSEGRPPALQAMVHSPFPSQACEKGKKTIQKSSKSCSWEHGASHRRGEMAFAPGCLQQ